METTAKLKFGWLPARDCETMMKILQYVHETFPYGVINTTELGVNNGHTSRAIHQFFTDKQKINFHTAIDNCADMPIEQPFPGCNLIIGNSYEVYNQIQDNSQHFIFGDANHSLPMTVLDVFCYSKKVRKGGFFALHDTGAQIKPFTDYQKIGDRSDPDMSISCRRAAEAMGLLNARSFINGCTFEKILDEYDESVSTGGILLLKRIM